MPTPLPPTVYCCTVSLVFTHAFQAVEAMALIVKDCAEGNERQMGIKK